MIRRKSSAPLDKLDDRLRRLREQEETKRRGKFGDRGADPRGGLSLAMRVGVELVAALVVGVGIGLLLDRWLGTGPWLLVVFFLLGSAAGMLNVYRVMSGMSQSVGYTAEKKKPRNGETPDD